MRQIGEHELRVVLKYVLKQQCTATWNDVRSGHQTSRDRGLDRVTNALVQRMNGWEIIVPDPAENIFADLTSVQREQFGLPPRD